MINVEGLDLPDRPLTNHDIEKAVTDLKIKNFRGVYMRNTLPKKARKDECGILNLDSSSGRGSHWEMWRKVGKVKVVFDSYGLAPPSELSKYLANNTYFNTTQVQLGGWICGHYCLYELAVTNDSTESTLLRDMQLAINNLF